jgi:HSP20 family protein
MTTGLIRWSPETDVLRNRMDRLFNQMLGDVWGAPAATEEVSTRRWSPVVDIRETDEALMLTAELPGLTRDDVQITLDNNVLTLSGERSFEKESKGETFHRIERSYGAFSRSFTLPANVKTDQVEAVFGDGLLTVTLPKVEEAKPRKIEIR